MRMQLDKHFDWAKEDPSKRFQFWFSEDGEGLDPSVIEVMDRLIQMNVKFHHFDAEDISRNRLFQLPPAMFSIAKGRTAVPSDIAQAAHPHALLNWLILLILFLMPCDQATYFTNLLFADEPCELGWEMINCLAKDTNNTRLNEIRGERIFRRYIRFRPLQGQ